MTVPNNNPRLIVLKIDFTVPLTAVAAGEEYFRENCKSTSNDRNATLLVYKKIAIQSCFALPPFAYRRQAIFSTTFVEYILLLINPAAAPSVRITCRLHPSHTCKNILALQKGYKCSYYLKRGPTSLIIGLPL